MNQKTAPATEPVSEKYGAFKGVFTPSVLTILGVIMYLRFGWVVGEAGLIGAIVIVLFAHAVSVTTGLSICAIATNRTVKAGGDYYMLSRSLGMPIGGALGIALFFALGFSMSLYVLGFAESVVDVLGLQPSLLNLRIIGTVACVLLTALTFFSTSLALKIQYVVLAAIGLSIVSLFLGTSDAPPEAGRPILWFGADSASFETVFAVFFPAVTGFTAGVAMSGDLKDPRKAIPRGTLAAIGVGLLVYLTIPIFLAYRVDPAVLRDDKMIWMRLAWFSPLVVAGVFAATLSSALGSVLGAPRYLQALAMDGVVPRFMGRGHGPSNEPRVGTVVTFLVAQSGVMIGELDFIARIVTMFFLTSYGFLCLASGIQTWSGVSSFRPDFRTPAGVSFAGALLCFGLMFKLDTVAMVGAITVMGLIFVRLKRKEKDAESQNVWGGFWSTLVQKGVLRLHLRPDNSHSWRPNALVFGGNPLEREYMIWLSRWLFHGRGMSSYLGVIEGELCTAHTEALHLEKATRGVVQKIYPEMLTRITVGESVYSGVRHLAQTYGLPGVIPNTVLMGWGENTRDRNAFTRLIRDLLILDYNLLLLHYHRDREFGSRSTIDVWWGGIDRNGPLMLLIAYLLKSAETWAHATVRVNVIVDQQECEVRQKRLQEMLHRARVKAVAHMVVRKPNQTPVEQIVEVSRDTDLTVIGLAPPSESEEGEFVNRVSGFLASLGTVLIVRASTRFDGEEVLFEE